MRGDEGVRVGGHFQVRDFGPADLDAVLHLNAIADNPAADIPASLRRHPELLDIPGHFQALGAFLLGVIGADIVAMGALEPLRDGTFEIGYIRVAMAHRRRGYARAILAELEHRAMVLGETTTMLNVDAGNHGARALYESIGYVCVAITSGFDVDGQELHGAHYLKELPVEKTPPAT